MNRLMKHYHLINWPLVLAAAIVCIAGGCVERRLTINTQPQGAVVILNDEEIGTSPVTTSFEWYGDYNVIISKEDFQTLKTHRKLKRPWYDMMPFDFFVGVLYPGTIVNNYQWSFELQPAKKIEREQLINSSQNLAEQVQ